MRVVIVGAGLAGLTLALCLQRKGHEVVVLERSPCLRGAGYMIDFFGSGYDVGERLGLTPELETIHYPISWLSFLEPDGTPRFRIAYETMRQLLGGRHFNFMRGDLERVLFTALGERAQVQFGTTVTAVTQSRSGIVAIRSDGTELHADLLVGADGIHSRVRSLAFGDEDAFVRQLGYHTAAFVLDDESMRAQIGDAFATLTVPGRQIALYPIRGGKIATFWVHRSDSPIRIRPAILKKQKAGRSIARWFVPENRLRLAVRDAVMRASSSHLGGWVLRRRVSAESVIPHEREAGRH